jgi:hypothetical protein
MVVHFENLVLITRHCVHHTDEKQALRFGWQGHPSMARPMLYRRNEAVMKTNINFVQLISSVVGLSLVIGVATATAILGVAALLQ